MQNEENLLGERSPDQKELGIMFWSCNRRTFSVTREDRNLHFNKSHGVQGNMINSTCYWVKPPIVQDKEQSLRDPEITWESLRKGTGRLASEFSQGRVTKDSIHRCWGEASVKSGFPQLSPSLCTGSRRHQLLQADSCPKACCLTTVPLLLPGCNSLF